MKSDWAEQAFSQPVRVSVSFRAARDVVATVAGHPWVIGDYFCLRDAEILEEAAASIRNKLVKP